MNNIKMLDSQIRDFIDEFLYHETSHKGIIIYPFNGKIMIEYTGDNKPNKSVEFVIAKTTLTKQELHKEVSVKFDLLKLRLLSKGIKLPVNVKKLVYAKKKSDNINSARVALISFRNKLIQKCYEYTRDFDIPMVVSEKSDKVTITHNNQEYVLDVPDYDSINNPYTHETTLNLISIELTELMKILKD